MYDCLVLYVTLSVLSTCRKHGLRDPRCKWDIDAVA